jgi:type II secretory pathway pseudopilin PulG
MNCPHCGADVTPGSTLCPNCHARLATSGGGGPSLERPGAVTLLAALNLITGLLLLLLAVGGVVVIVMNKPPTEGMVIIGAFIVFAGLFGLWHLAAGVGLFTMKNYGRIAQIGLAGLSLLSIPLGTIVGALLLIYLLKPGAKILFSGEEPRTPQEMADLAAVRASGGLVIGAVAVQVVTVFVVIGIVGMMSAIAIPSLLHARTAAGQASAIGDLRTMVSAQVAYQSANAGYYESNIECLATPAVNCIPNYPATGPSFVGQNLTRSPRHGYDFQLFPGSRPDPLDLSTMSPSSVAEFAYLAKPVESGPGRRVFCADQNGIICQWHDGTVPDVSSGRCPADCNILQ